MRRRIFSGIALLIMTVSCSLDGFLFNSKKIDEYTLPGNTIPSDHLEQVSFNSGGNKLYGYWVESNGENPGVTVLYCHGNKHNIDNYWDRVLLMYELGVNIFIFDYRGFGLSEGTSSEDGLHQDAESALNYVLSREEVSEDSLVFYGYSLGNVPSIHLAATKFNPLCLIAESPFASSNSLTQSAFALDLPVGWLTKGKFDNAEKIKHIKTPLLLLHGGNDDFVRYRDNGKIIYENAPEPKKLLLVNSANHTDIPMVYGEQKYIQLLRDWIKQWREK